MKDLLIITIIFACSLFLWFHINLSIVGLESRPPLEESIGNFANNSVRIDLEYLKNLPAYEPKQ
jgi:hypothetical protein